MTTRPDVLKDLLVWICSYKGKDVVKAVFALPFYPILPDKVEKQINRARYRLVGKERAGNVFSDGKLDFMKR